MKIFVINGPSINLLGVREPEIYGNKTYEDLLKDIKKWSKELNVEVKTFQSNVEGEIVNFIQDAYYQKADGIVINPAAYTHTSVAILDALKAVSIPTVEVHISNINEREEFRKKSYISEICIKTIMGKGLDGYKEAMELLKNYLEAQHGSKR